MATANKVTEAKRWIAEHRKTCITCHQAGQQADKLCDTAYAMLLAAMRIQNREDERQAEVLAGQGELFTMAELGA